jgi:hypothetical protein
MHSAIVIILLVSFVLIFILIDVQYFNTLNNTVLLIFWSIKIFCYLSFLSRGHGTCEKNTSCFGRFCLNTREALACEHKLFKVTNSVSPVCHGFKDVVTPVHIPLHKFYTYTVPHADIQMFKTRMFSSPRQKYFQIFWNSRLDSLCS